MNESQFQTMVITAAQAYGWRVAHFRKARTAKGWTTAVAANGKGFPDLFCVRRKTGHRFAAELKIPPNKVTPDQNEWLDALEMSGIPAFVWTPADWTEIESVLKDGPN